MDKAPKKSDYQTASIFVILAVLTGVFVLGVRWALLAPSYRTPAAISVEGASK